MGNQNATPILPVTRTIIKTEEEQNRTLSQYFEDLYEKKLKFRRPVEEIRDITDAVTEMVDMIMKILGEKDSRFIIKQSVLVGSMAEGTSNHEPKEFDFQVFIADFCSCETNKYNVLSKNVIDVVRACNYNIGFAHIVIKDSALLSKWSYILNGNQLKSVNVRYFFRKDCFRELFKKALNHAILTIFEKKQMIVKETGWLTLHCKKSQTNGPAFKCLFAWRPNAQIYNENLNIAVDIVPAIQGYNLREVVTEDMTNNTFWNKVLQHNEYSLIPVRRESTCKDGLCFMLIFTQSEIALIQNLSRTHFVCYRVLKYLFNGVQATPCYVLFHSYALKTIVLTHSSKCPGDKCLAKCLKEVLADIKAYFDKRKQYGSSLHIGLKNIFLKHQDVYKTNRCREFAEHNEVPRLIQSLNEIANKPIYNYRDCNINLKLVEHYVFIQPKCIELLAESNFDEAHL